MGDMIRPAALNSSRQLSPSLWGGCRLHDFAATLEGIVLLDDFVNTPVFATTVAQAGWYPFQDSGALIQGIPTEVGGVLRFSTSATDNDQASLCSDGNTGAAVKIATAAQKRLWFETRLRIAQLAETGIFVGLTEEALCADNGILADNTGAAADKDFIGFHVPMHATLADMDIRFNKASGGGITTVKNNAQVMVANTWYKFGMRYDPEHNGKLTFFINGVEVAYVNNITGGTNVQTDDGTTKTSVALTKFPDGEELCVSIHIKAGEAGDKIMDVDWVALAQET